MPLLHGELTKRIIGCFYEVHHELGIGFPESVYSRAMEIALKEKGIAVQREVLLKVGFRGRVVGRFSSDTIVESRIILEYKTAPRAVEVAEAQLLNYLNCTNKEVGLLLKFFHKPTFKRLFASNERKGTRRLPWLPRASAFPTSPTGAGSLRGADQAPT